MKRRDLLRSILKTGVSLPMAKGLVAMSRVQAAEAATPLKLITLYTPHGSMLSRWRPKPLGQGYHPLDWTLSYPDYVDLVDATRDLFSEIGGAQLAFIQGDTDSGVEGLLAEAVTGSYFGVLGIRPELGRLFGEQDDLERGAHPVVVLRVPRSR